MNYEMNFLKNTPYKPTNFSISFNYLDNPQLQKRLEENQGKIQFNINKPMVPPYRRMVYDYTNPMWIPNAAINPQSQCPIGRKKQSQVDIIDCALEIKEVSLILNLETEEISLQGTKLPCDLQKEECQPTPFTKATIVSNS